MYTSQSGDSLKFNVLGLYKVGEWVLGGIVFGGTVCTKTQIPSKYVECHGGSAIMERCIAIHWIGWWHPPPSLHCYSAPHSRHFPSRIHLGHAGCLRDMDRIAAAFLAADAAVRGEQYARAQGVPLLF